MAAAWRERQRGSVGASKNSDLGKTEQRLRWLLGMHCAAHWAVSHLAIARNPPCFRPLRTFAAAASASVVLP